ncbi:cyclic nucleotide-binding protein [Legionella gratiana]|uniref:Cyclic nucleotide-binding protein n=1 Tax=Legionella gratiana TaxID=45066 RepID=A0A378JFI1_9GAMM|nr:cyclic nucleotide-binding domain-containing protein [Legionella gratiana]KTD11876.1 cyclic nucleotide-binding protein [Legionella gratiana]STX46532.1 cyclic nucleotide-binding protein [Legionella gratiana]
MIRMSDLSDFQTLFQNINPQDLEILLHFVKRVKLKKDQYLFYEETQGDSVYLIKSGKIGIESKGQHLSDLYSGDYLGEMSILDKRPRSSSVYAANPSELYAINMVDLQNKYPNLYTQLIVNLSKALPDRLREANKLATKALKKEIFLLKNQIKTARFMTYLLVIISLFIILKDTASWAQFTENPNVLNIRITLVLALIFFVIMWKNGYSLAEMGLTLKNSKQSIIESLIVSFFIICSFLLIKWVLITNTLYFKETPLVCFCKNIYELLELSIGYIILAPIQEFIARGCLQSSLMHYVKRDQSIYAVLMSNLIFCSFYSSFALSASILLFILGLIWGWLYLRYQTLIGVSLSHMLVGICLTGVIGFPIQLL